MPALSSADTIRVLVATDSHVGYEERDPIRKDDSWRSFDEAMCLAKSEDVDMVLLAGDLFHDNKPSRKALYQVMRSLRLNCLGDKPCELEMLSDGGDVFEGAISHVNYEDEDINVAIPVFSIHGNHDDPTGDGHFCSLDLLQMSGLLNYYGRTPESDNIDIKPILLQKGQTKLALYGMSNVRDERLFRTFRDGKVKFFKPGVQQADWFNLMAVHQNHHAYTETGYLPENFLPEFLDLVVWGHEHECLIDPRRNPETMFHVMQPGSSVATSLVAGEAVPKHVAIVSITGRDFKVEKHRLKSVRPFIMRELVLADEKRFRGIEKKKDNKQEVTLRLMEVVEELIKEAIADWKAVQDELDDISDVPLPLVRLRVEYSSPEGGKYECENPQRFSNRFVGKVANVNDVVQFFRKKKGVTKSKNDTAEMPEEAALASLAIDNVKIERLVHEFLDKQSLKILPQAPFGDAVTQFVDKDDKHAMEMFVTESLQDQVKQMLDLEAEEDEDIESAMAQYRAQKEAQFQTGATVPSRRKGVLKPRPDDWDSDMDGEWEDAPDAWELVRDDGNTTRNSAAPISAPAPASRTARAAFSDNDDEEDEDEDTRHAPVRKTATAKESGLAHKAAAKKTTTHPARATKRAPTKAPTRSSRRRAATPISDDDEEMPDVVDDDDDDDEDDEDDNTAAAAAPTTRRTTAQTRAQPSKTQPTKAQASRAQPIRKSNNNRTSTVTTTPKARGAPARQTRLDFSQATSQRSGTAAARSQVVELSDDVISDDEDGATVAANNKHNHSHTRKRDSRNGRSNGKSTGNGNGNDDDDDDEDDEDDAAFEPMLVPAKARRR